ncbi:MAG: porin [Gammaproteobacteria bacterium]|nr:porin [Gammaproteobacteria bacterium]
MKKSIIALAVVAAGFAQADGTVLFGEAKTTYTLDTGDRVANSVGKLKSKTSSKFDVDGKFGIKGTDDLGNGMTAFYQFETGKDGSFGAKKAFAGIKGDFGTFSFGNQATPRDMLGNFSDPSNQLGSSSWKVGEDNDGDDINEGRSAFDSKANSAAYISPDMGGVTVAAAIVADGEGGVDRHVDGYDLLAQYSANGIYAGIGFQGTTDKASTKNLGLGLGYGNDAFNVGLLVEKELTKGKNTPDPVFARLGGSYNVSDADSIYGTISYYDDDQKNTKPGITGAVGYQHTFSKQTKAWVEYGYANKKANIWDGKNKDTSNKFGVGLKTVF